MERMPTHDRHVCVLSSCHIGAGKSYYFGLLSTYPEYQGPRVFKSSVDEIRVKYYGSRAQHRREDTAQGHRDLYDDLTELEKTYSNEVLRVDTERALLIDNVERVLLDVVMLTRAYRQRPFVGMICKVEDYLQRIEAERAFQQHTLPPDPPSHVELRVVLLYCDFKTAVQRIYARGYADKKAALIPLGETAAQYELPIDYPFLAVNTSDTNPQAEAKRLQEIREFFNGYNPDFALRQTRAKEAKCCIADIKQQVRKQGFHKPLPLPRA